MTTKQVHRAKEQGSVQLQQELAAIEELAKKGEDEHWLIGWHYNRMVGKFGFKTARAYLAKHLRALAQSTLNVYGTIAKAFTEDDAKKYGVSALRLLLSYERRAASHSGERTHFTVSKGDPGEVLIPIPQKDGSTQKKQFAQCTIEEIRAAIRHLQEPKQSLDPYDQKILDEIQKAIHEVGGDDPLVGLKAHPNPRAGVTVDFSVPIEHLDDLHAVLAKVLGKEQDDAADDGRKHDLKDLVKFGKEFGKMFEGARKAPMPRRKAKRRGRPQARG